jgi:cobalamin synthase
MLPSNLWRQYRIFGGINIATFLVLIFLYGFLTLHLPEENLSPMTPLIILFFTVVNILMFYAKLRITYSKDSKFVNMFLIFNSLKIILFIALIMLYAFFYRDDAINFAVSFFICYAIYTIILVKKYNSVQHYLRK